MHVLGRRRPLAAVVTITTVLLVSCGDDESSSPATSTTTTTISQIEADRQKAQRIVLTPADVPGFTVDPPDPTDESTALDDAANACVNNNPLLVRLGEDDDVRGAGSPDFSRGDELSVDSSVTFGDNENEPRSAITDLGAASFPDCFSRAIATELRKDPSFTGVTVTTARLPALSVGDESLAYRSTVRTTVSGTPLTLYFDFTFVRVARALSVLSGFSVNTPFPEADRVRLATTIAGRMAAP